MTEINRVETLCREIAQWKAVCESQREDEMSEQKHTPEPWIYQASIPEEGYECFWVLSRDRQISSFDGPQSEEQFANVRRVIACVNACAGIKTEDLESNTSVVLFFSHMQLIDERDKLTRQRDELLAALEKFNEVVTSVEEVEFCDAAHYVIPLDVFNEFEAEVDAAIASVKGDPCKGAGGCEVAASSTSYFWKECPDCAKGGS